MVEKIDYQPSLGKSDHVVLSFNFNVYRKGVINTKKYNFNEGDYESCVNYLSTTDWFVMQDLNLVES